jgi:hypothetical protein
MMRRLRLLRIRRRARRRRGYLTLTERTLG